MIWTLRESAQGVKSTVLTSPGIHQQRAPWHSAAPSSLRTSSAWESWGIERKLGEGASFVEGGADLSLETLSGAGKGIALSRTRV